MSGKVEVSTWLELHRVQLQTRLWQLSKENPGCDWLDAAVLMNLPRYVLVGPESVADRRPDPFLFQAN